MTTTINNQLEGQIDNIPMVSVIVGIYNVKQYILRGTQSFAKQTFQDFEIILIDDGATDGSSDLCDAIALGNKQIRVIHKANGGLGSARNAGLDAARGKYVYFYDVDDRVSPDLLGYCIGKMEESRLDMMIFGFETIDVAHSNKADKVIFREHRIESNDELRGCYVDELLLVRNGNGFVWNKFYRKSFLDKYHLRFENQRIQQDEVFNLKVYTHVERAYISPDTFYTYYIYSKGNTRSRFIPERFDIYVSIREHFESLKAYWQLDDPRLDDYLQKRFWSSLIGGIIPNLFHPDCQWDCEQKDKEFKRITKHPFTQSCMAYMAHAHGIENMLYRQSFLHDSLLMASAIYKSLSLLKKIKHLRHNKYRQH